MRSRTRRIAAATVVTLVSASWSGSLTAQLSPRNEAGVSIAAVYLTVRDPSAHVRLWKELFNVDAVSMGSTQMVKIPGVFLILEQGEPSAGSAGANVDHEGFLVPDYADVKARLSARGLPVVLDNADGKQVTFEFPDGVKVEFSEAAELSVPIAHHHIHMFVTERESLRDWYVRTFSATPSARNQFISAIFPGEGLFTGAGACRQESGDFRCPRIDFASARESRPTNTDRAINRIGLEVRGLDQFVEKLEAEGIAVEAPPREVPGSGLKKAVIVDPVGTRIELTEGLAGR